MRQTGEQRARDTKVRLPLLVSSAVKPRNQPQVVYYVSESWKTYPNHIYMYIDAVVNRVILLLYQELYNTVLK